jgi:SAM-dependent methyltransferase
MIKTKIIAIKLNIKPTMTSYNRSDFFDMIPITGKELVLDIGASQMYDFSSEYISKIHIQKYGKYISLWDPIYTETTKNIYLIDELFANRVEEFKERTNVQNISGNDIRSLPYENNKFDIALLGYIFDHFIDDKTSLEKVISESSRVVKDKGYIIADVPLHPEYQINDEKSIYELPNFPTYIDTIAEYKQLYNKHGFSIKHHGTGYIGKFTPRYLSYYILLQKN